MSSKFCEILINLFFVRCISTRTINPEVGASKIVTSVFIITVVIVHN